jgi:hypothetical protein
MPRIDVIDSTWIPLAPESVAVHVAEPANWRRWWPGLELTVHERRGAKGVRWTVGSVQSAADGGLAGTAEVWLQPMFDGVIAHFFLRLDPKPGRRLNARRARHIERIYRWNTKRAFWALADQGDPHRMDRARGVTDEALGAGLGPPAVPTVPGSV